jgi:hypothetical protein
MFDQPCLERPIIRITVGMKPGQVGILLGCFFVQVIVIIQIIIFNIRLRLI